MTQIPQDPVGKSGLVETVKRILRVLRSQRIVAGPGLQVDYSTNQTTIRLAKSNSKGGSGGDGPTPKWG